MEEDAALRTDHWEHHKELIELHPNAMLGEEKFWQSFLTPLRQKRLPDLSESPQQRIFLAKGPERSRIALVASHLARPHQLTSKTLGQLVP
jgi:hypothetical protein